MVLVTSRYCKMAGLFASIVGLLSLAKSSDLFNAMSWAISSIEDFKIPAVTVHEEPRVECFANNYKQFNMALTMATLVSKEKSNRHCLVVM